MTNFVSIWFSLVCLKIIELNDVCRWMHGSVLSYIPPPMIKTFLSLDFEALHMVRWTLGSARADFLAVTLTLPPTTSTYNDIIKSTSQKSPLIQRNFTLIMLWVLLYLTLNLGMLSRPGKSSMSPVFTLKQAPCQGQRTLPLQWLPLTSGAP